MFPSVWKFLKKFKSNDLQKKAQKERKRLYMEVGSSENTFKKRKRTSIRIPDWISKTSLKSHLKILYIFFLIFLAGGSLLVLYWPFFKIKTIEIIRKDDITDINIAYKSLEDYRDRLIFSINTKDIAEQLKLYQKNISDVSIKTVFPDTLKITVWSYKWVFSTVINEKNYIVTSNGVLVPGKWWSDLQILKFTQQYATINGILDYKEVFSAEYIEKIIEILNKIRYNLLTSQIKALYYFPKEREVHVDTDTTKLIFDIDGDIEDQIKRLVVFTKEKSNIKKTWILYIDLRIKNKIFFCTLETEFDCRKNLNYFYQYK